LFSNYSIYILIYILRTKLPRTTEGKSGPNYWQIIP